MIIKRESRKANVTIVTFSNGETISENIIWKFHLKQNL